MRKINKNMILNIQATKKNKPFYLYRKNNLFFVKVQRSISRKDAETQSFISRRDAKTQNCEVPFLAETQRRKDLFYIIFTLCLGVRRRMVAFPFLFALWQRFFSRKGAETQRSKVSFLAKTQRFISRRDAETQYYISRRDAKPQRKILGYTILLILYYLAGIRKIIRNKFYRINSS